MDYNAKVHLCYYNANYLVSCKDKRKVNLRMECTILEMLQDIELCKSYLHNQWYMLRYFDVFMLCRLLYKILSVFGSLGMCSKLNCHNLQDGPRPVVQNLSLFTELVVFTQIQIQIIGSII